MWEVYRDNCKQIVIKLCQGQPKGQGNLNVNLITSKVTITHNLICINGELHQKC